MIGTPKGKEIQFQVTIDGKAPRNNHGQDIDSNGYGKVKSHRLYQLIRQSNKTEETQDEHTFQIEFLDSGAEVYAFTFG